MSLDFPLPFSGINSLIRLPEITDFAQAVLELINCGHGHKFAIESPDGTARGNRIWTTEAGVNCLIEKMPEQLRRAEEDYDRR